MPDAPRGFPEEARRLEYRRMGKSGLKLSAIGLGSWFTYGSKTDRETAIRTIRRAYELGVNHFDTADVYARGEAERIVGDALRAFPRETYVLATKVYWPTGETVTERGLSRKHIVESIDASLRRLGLEYVDVYYAHRFDPETDLEETLRAFDDLVRAGKVLYIGVSMWSVEQLKAARDLAEKLLLHPIAVDQPEYNLLRRDIEGDVLPYARSQGLGVVVYSPLAQGVLTGKYRPGQAPPPSSRAADPRMRGVVERYLDEVTLRRVERFAALARNAGVTPSQLALAWVLRRPEVTSALVGASRPEQLEENLGALEVRLTDDILAAVEEIFAGGAEEDS
ncbi:MAG: Potassium channel beta chain [Brockia lithotrophica]|uniref:Potassium channel beta chain n=1 Tax=Brockia lithotrophica TaxID=933949 RepID=A0A2T5G645_9BACL|nr:MAG: Potassium channel beta chain [Brockia lithotrophica]